MPHLFIFGMGYSAKRIAALLRAQGWTVSGTGSDGDVDFADPEAVNLALGEASHILSSVPPDRSSGQDPVLERYGRALATAPAQWIGYLSSTGVYGDAQGGWVDEATPIGDGRRSARAEADAAWQALVPERIRVFRLPGIYGPGRSALDRVRSGKANRIDLPGQVFSRVHVDDIASGVLAGLEGPPGVYNLGDDQPCSQNAVIEYACQLLGTEPPPLQTLEEANLSAMAQGFYAENRRVANGKARRVLGWQPTHRDYRAGLDAILAQELSVK